MSTCVMHTVIYNITDTMYVTWYQTYTQVHQRSQEQPQGSFTHNSIRYNECMCNVYCNALNYLIVFTLHHLRHTHTCITARKSKPKVIAYSILAYIPKCVLCIYMLGVCACVYNIIIILYCSVYIILSLCILCCSI